MSLNIFPLPRERTSDDELRLYPEIDAFSPLTTNCCSQLLSGSRFVNSSIRIMDDIFDRLFSKIALATVTRSSSCFLAFSSAWRSWRSVFALASAAVRTVCRFSKDRWIAAPPMTRIASTRPQARRPK